MTFEQRAELMADFVEAAGNKYSPLQDEPRLFEALKEFNDVYRERRVHGFSEAKRESYIAAFVKLLGRQD